MIMSSILPDFVHLVFGKKDPKGMWDTLKQQQDSIDANSGPLILRSQFLGEKYSRNGSISLFFAKIQEYKIRLLGTAFLLRDLDFISHALTSRALPSQYEPTVKVLQLQAPTTTWNQLTKVFINEGIQLDSQKPANTAMAIGGNSENSRNPRNKHKNTSDTYLEKKMAPYLDSESEK